MIEIASRHKSSTLLAAVVIAQVLLLAAQIKSDRQVRLIRVWAVELISPIQRSGSWIIYNFAHGWGNYVSLRNTRQDNESLRSERDRLKVRNAELEGRALQADRLAAMLNFRPSHPEVPMPPPPFTRASPASHRL